MEATEDILKEMRYGAGISNHFDGNCIREYADRIEASMKAHPNFDDYARLREELRATRERRDECEAKMYKAFERVTAAEERERKLKEEIRGLQDAMGEDTLLMQARDIDRANEEIRRLKDALKPVLECEDRWEGHWTFAARAADAVHEAQRIYREVMKENNEGKEVTDGKD